MQAKSATEANQDLGASVQLASSMTTLWSEESFSHSQFTVTIKPVPEQSDEESVIG